MDTHGPYKATKLWNDIIRTFRTSMPVGRHRKGMRVYENCFCAADAVDWLQVHLSKNPNFGSDVGRHQIVQLLGKFHKSGVFHDVRSDAKHNAEPFEDSSSRLFKFSLVETTLSPLTGYQQQQPDVFALQLVAFMTAHYSLIFRAPADLRECVEARLADMRALRQSRPQACCGSSSCGGGGASGRHAVAPTGPQQQPLPVTDRRQFCSRIPAEQFSLAGRLNSDQALLDLLEGILGDENLPARDKKRKLRLFKESHPHVYSARFPDTEVERSVLNGLRGPQQQGFLGRTLTALRNWRL